MAAKQMAFRFDEELIRQVKIKAKADHRSLNNYLEVLMLKDIGKIPNKETQKAIEEVMSDKDLEEIKGVDEFMDSL